MRGWCAASCSKRSVEGCDAALARGETADQRKLERRGTAVGEGEDLGTHHFSRQDFERGRRAVGSVDLLLERHVFANPVLKSLSPT